MARYYRKFLLENINQSLYSQRAFHTSSLCDSRRIWPCFNGSTRHVTCGHQWPLLLRWFNFNASMDKWLHQLKSVGWNYLNSCTVEVCKMDKQFHPTLCHIHSWQKRLLHPQLKTIKPMWIELLCFHLAEIGMIWTRDCSPTKSDTTLGRHSMQGQVGSSSSETTV